MKNESSNFIMGKILKLIFHKEHTQNVSKIMKHVPFKWCDAVEQ